MLNTYSSIWDYRAHLKSSKYSLDPSQLKRLNSSLYRSACHKLRKMDPGLILDVLLPLYSHTGRPAIDPAILLRSFILMLHLGYTSIHRWCDDLKTDSLLQYLVGSSSPPSMASHYDFIIRLTRVDPHLSTLYLKDHFKKPNKKKLKKGEKLINFTFEDTQSLLDKYKNGAEADRERMMFTLQSLFNFLVVIPSFDKGLIDSDNLTLSADGSSLHVHSSVFGHKVKDSEDENEKTYRFSAPDADIGWDSDLESYYLGYTFYNIAYHSSAFNCDLPVFISIEKASRHDALSCISTAAQFLDLNPDIHPKYFCHDSAADSLAIYQFFRLHNITPVIDRNVRRESKKDYSEKEHINENGIPVCCEGQEMIYFGYDVARGRKKYRCPLAMGKIDSCPHSATCSSSSYGRTVYINDGDDAKNAGPLVYRSDKWKEIYKNRTSTERINNRVLNDYSLHKMKIRDKAKHAFFAVIAGINIHLDAWIKCEQ